MINMKVTFKIYSYCNSIINSVFVMMVFCMLSSWTCHNAEIKLNLIPGMVCSVCMPASEGPASPTTPSLSPPPRPAAGYEGEPRTLPADPHLGRPLLLGPTASPLLMSSAGLGWWMANQYGETRLLVHYFWTLFLIKKKKTFLRNPENVFLCDYGYGGDIDPPGSEIKNNSIIMLSQLALCPRHPSLISLADVSANAKTQLYFPLMWLSHVITIVLTIYEHLCKACFKIHFVSVSE